MKHKQSIFNGLMVKIDNVDMPPEYTPDCKNVVVHIRGELSNIEGMEKQHTSDYSNDIVAIHQLDTTSETLKEIT